MVGALALSASFALGSRLSTSCRLFWISEDSIDGCPVFPDPHKLSADLIYSAWARIAKSLGEIDGALRTKTKACTAKVSTHSCSLLPDRLQIPQYSQVSTTSVREDNGKKGGTRVLLGCKRMLTMRLSLPCQSPRTTIRPI